MTGKGTGVALIGALAFEAMLQPVQATVVEAKISAAVPVICRMNTVSAGSAANGYTLTFSTFCNTNHSARVMLESDASLANAVFIYQGRRILLTGNVLTLYNGSLPQKGVSQLTVQGLTDGATLSVTPEINTGV